MHTAPRRPRLYLVKHALYTLSLSIVEDEIRLDFPNCAQLAQLNSTLHRRDSNPGDVYAYRESLKGGPQGL